MNRVIALLAALLTIAPGAMGQEIEPEELQFLVIEALSRNPDIRAELHRMDLAANRVPQAGTLADPELNLKVMEFPGLKLNEAMYTNLELMQMITFPTKLSLRKDIALLETEHAHHNHLEKVFQVISQLKSSAAMLWSARASLELNRQNQQLLQQIQKAAETLYGVGKTSQQDVLKTHVEFALLKTQEASLQQEVISAESMLRALLNRPSTKPIGPLELGPFVPVQRSVNDFLDYAFKNRPMLLHDSLGVTQSKLMIEMARQEYIPDLKLSVEYVTSPLRGHKLWSFMAGISIPFAPWTLSKASARVEEATAERSMKESMFIASKNMIRSSIQDASARVKAAEVQVRAFDKTIVPQTYQSLQALMTEYQTGRASYLMLLDTYRMYKNMKMEAIMARMKYEQAIAALERNVGVIDLSIVPVAEKENE